MQIAIAYAPCPKFFPKMRYAFDAFRSLGHRVRRVESLDDLRRADAECELVLFDHKNCGLNKNDVAAIGRTKRATWFQWWRDLIAYDPGASLERQGYFVTFSEMMRAMDGVYVKERDLLDVYRSHGINASWLDQGCPADYPACVHERKPEFDVVLFGSSKKHYRERRRDVSALADAGFRIAWFGDTGGYPRGVYQFPWTHPNDLPALMTRAAVTLCVDLRSEVAGYWSDRIWLSMGAGACAVRRYSDGQPSDWPCLSYTTSAELVEHVGRCITDFDFRKELGARARRYTLENHTYRHRAERILSEWTASKPIPVS